MTIDARRQQGRRSAQSGKGAAIVDKIVDNPHRAAGRPRTSRAVRVVLVLLVALALSLLGGTAATATGRTGTATVVGWVRGISDDPVNGMHGPLAGATVKAVDAHSGRVLAATVTRDSGRFRLGSVPATAVKIHIAKTGFLPVWADNSRTWAGATTFHLHPGQTLTVTHRQRLYAEAVIEGTVLEDFDPASDPVRVEVFDAQTHRLLGAADTIYDNPYRIGGLPARPIKVHAVPLAGLWMDGWADGAASWNSARTFQLYAGEHLVQSWDPITLYLDLGYAGEVTGTVVGKGRPIRGARIAVFDQSGSVLARGRSNCAGRYRVRFSDSTGFDVKVRASKKGWRPVWANNRASFATADPIFIASQQSVHLQPLVLKRRGERSPY